MAPVPSSAAGPSDKSSSDESGIIRQLRSKIAGMERDLMTLHAGAAVVKKKGELAIAMENYARDELVKATRSLQCK